ncbi:hypothetical protein RHS01_09953 [Rhizoctonia solani]|uniref:Uncharacterized protein n=1 Tax=Rhizoctonia solani TaxID=456999 RepID=A0A8H7I5P3_9AGAM|nr:hypothetical protein RHS01_09953 [Rhizoctonia solani]
MPSLDLLPVHSSPSAESNAIYEDSASSEGLPTPLDVPSRNLHFMDHSADAPLSIDIPNKTVPPLIGTPFITDSASLFEYPFPPSSSRPPLSTTSSSSSVTSIPGPPASVALDKHIPHVFARLSNRTNRPRRSTIFRRLASIHPCPDNEYPISKGCATEALPSRDTVAVAQDRLTETCTDSTSAIGLVLPSTAGACAETIPISGRRRSMPAVLSDPNQDDTGYAPSCSNRGNTERNVRWDSKMVPVQKGGYFRVDFFSSYFGDIA